MALQDEIIKKSAQIRTDSYSMSIGELLNLYRDGELDVHPEFQRIFRWTESQKTRLIESILLGIPIPPIFVAQRSDGVWDVVDGVQRLSTIFQLMGELKDNNGKLMEPLELEGTKFLPSLAGKTWNGGNNSLTKDQQLYIKRAKIDINIVLKESDDKSKYELFMRLNTGGTALEPQEVRNCLMIMAYPETYNWIRQLAEDDNFLASVSLPDQSISEQYPMELVTRFLTFRELDEAELPKIGDLNDFLNDNIENLNVKRESQRRTEEKVFKSTFKCIYESMGDSAFRRYDPGKDRFLGGFLISAFEVVALGIGANSVKGSLLSAAKLAEKVKSIWTNPIFNNNSGSGVRASSRIPKTVALGRKLFSNE